MLENHLSYFLLSLILYLIIYFIHFIIIQVLQELWKFLNLLFEDEDHIVILFFSFSLCNIYVIFSLVHWILFRYIFFWVNVMEYLLISYFFDDFILIYLNVLYYVRILSYLQDFWKMILIDHMNNFSFMTNQAEGQDLKE